MNVSGILLDMRTTHARATPMVDEQGYELVPCACTPPGYRRLVWAGQCGDCGRYTCDDCSAGRAHPSTPCRDCDAALPRR